MEKKLLKKLGQRVIGILGLIVLIMGFIYIHVPLIYGGDATLYGILFKGADLSVEAKYPPIDDQQILVSYINSGGIPLENIHAEYTLTLNENILIPPKSFYAELDKRSLKEGDRGQFYINISNVNKKECFLLKNDPLADIYTDYENKKCYFLIHSNPGGGYCIPSKVNITFLSGHKEFKKEFYYPLSFNTTNFYMWQFGGTVACEEIYSSLDEEENLIIEKGAILQGFMKIMGADNALNLSKKYCHEGLMPLEWCVRNNLN